MSRRSTSKRNVHLDRVKAAVFADVLEEGYDVLRESRGDFGVEKIGRIGHPRRSLARAKTAAARHATSDRLADRVAPGGAKLYPHEIICCVCADDY